MKAALWLAWVELRARGRQFLWSVALVAAAVALLSATELVSRAREAAVVSQLDYLGPTLKVVPAGVTSIDLARFELAGRVLPQRTVSLLGDELSHWLRSVEGRLLLRLDVDAVESPVVGMPPGGVAALVSVDGLGPTEVLLGADLARRLAKKTGDRVDILGRSWRVAGVLPPLGSAEDVELFMRLSTLQQIGGAGQAVNEIRLYARSAASSRELAALLRARHPELSVLGSTGRGQAAERETGATLRRHRNAAYWLMGLVVAIGLATAAYINAAERRVEMAMLVVMGGTAAAVLVTLLARAAIVGLVGAVVGYSLGGGIAVALDARAAVAMAWSWTQPAIVTIAAAALSMAAALPVSIYATYQNHVRALQE